jgi:ubiquinone/menaquinone biosynthesis C-methylase UbiE
VLEIAIGTGLNPPFYPADVRLTGIEISSAMLEIARRRSHSLGRQVDLVIGDAQALPFPDQHFDTVVCTIALCSIPRHYQ